MTMDPSLPGQLLQAARAVAEVRQSVTTSARTAGSATVPGGRAAPPCDTSSRSPR